MKRHVIGFVASITVASALVAAQSTPPPPPAQQAAPAAQEQKAPEITLAGCVIQGSGPTVFILGNAKLNPQDKNEKVKTYVLVAEGEGVDFTRHVNHEVTLKGVAEQKAPSTVPPEKQTEKDLPRFSVKSLTMVADTCTSAGQ